MAEMPRAEIRPMDFGEILDTTMRLLKTGWKPLLLTGLLSTLPMLLYNGLMLSLMPRRTAFSGRNSTFLFEAILGAERGDFTRLFALGGIFVALVLVMALTLPLLYGALVVIASRLYLGLPVTLGMALRIAGRRYPALLGTYGLMFLFGLLALPAFILGGLVFLAVLTVPIGYLVLAVWTAFVGQALLIEGVPGGMGPLKRSYGLSKGRFWSLLGLGILTYLFTMVLGTQITFLTQVPAQLFMSVNHDPALAKVLVWVVALSGALLGTVITPLQIVAKTLAYYDTRMRKEGLDIEMMVQA